MTNDSSIPEEELKNRVARDMFCALDCQILLARLAPKVREYGFLR